MIFYIMDIETTGFNRQSDNMLEVGYIKVNQHCEILGSGTLFFYKPSFYIESPAQKVHGLTREFLKQYENQFLVNIASLYTIMHQGLIIGKNNKTFDIPFIKDFLGRSASYLDPVEIMGHVDLQDFFTEYFRVWYEQTKGVSAGRKKGTLTELVGMIGYTEEQIREGFLKLFPDCPRSGAHSALFDTYMTYLLLVDACTNKHMSLEV